MPDVIVYKFPSESMLRTSELILAGELPFKRISDLELEIDVTDRVKVSEITKRLRAQWFVIVRQAGEYVAVYAGLKDEAYEKFEALAKNMKVGTILLCNGTNQVDSCVNGTRIRRFR